MLASGLPLSYVPSLPLGLLSPPPSCNAMLLLQLDPLLVYWNSLNSVTGCEGGWVKPSSCGSVFQSLRGAVTWDCDLQNNLCSDTQSLSMDAGISVSRKPLLLLTAPSLVETDRLGGWEV